MIHLLPASILPLPAAVLVTAADRAWALQPLAEFVRGARTHDPANHEARASREAADAQADEALGRALPGVAAVGTYTRNQREVAFGDLKITPRDQWDATVALT